MKPLASAWRAWTSLFEDDAPDEARFDPAHLAAVLVGTQVVVGAVFWLLWTLLVYEGGLFVKVSALVLGPRDEDSLRGLWGNLTALAVLGLALAALHRADRKR